MIFQGSKRYPVHEVCLHTPAVPGDWHEGKTAVQMRDEIRRWHTDKPPRGNGWRDIGYHRVVAPSGRIVIGRSIYDIGAGVMGHNRGVIHICMINVADHKGVTRFEDYFTEAQRQAVRRYINDELAPMTRIRLVSGHNDYAAKECPGFKVKTEDWLDRVAA